MLYSLWRVTNDKILQLSVEVCPLPSPSSRWRGAVVAMRAAGCSKSWHQAALASVHGPTDLQRLRLYFLVCCGQNMSSSAPGEIIGVYRTMLCLWAQLGPSWGGHEGIGPSLGNQALPHGGFGGIQCAAETVQTAT